MSDPLQRAANRTAAEADRLSAAFGKQLSKVMTAVEVQLRAWVKDAAGRRISPKIRRDVRAVLTDAGFDDLATAATAAPFDEIEARVLAARKAVDSAIGESAAGRGRLEALRLWHLDDLLTEGTVITRSLGNAIVRGRGPRAARRLPQEIGKILEHADTRLQTLYDTAVSIYSRQVEGEQAGDDPATVFAYMGPVDMKTRAFCMRHVGKVYTRAEIDTLDNGQISNVFLTAGGYNCRHTWHEVSKFSELYPLQGTGERAPEIADAVDELKAA